MVHWNRHTRSRPLLVSVFLAFPALQPPARAENKDPTASILADVVRIRGLDLRTPLQTEVDDPTRI